MIEIMRGVEKMRLRTSGGAPSCSSVWLNEEVAPARQANHSVLEWYRTMYGVLQEDAVVVN